MIYHIDTTILLRDFLQTVVSKAMIKRIKREGDLLVNGKHQTVRYMLQPGDILEIVLPIETSTIIPEDIPINIVYEDKYYLIIDKQANIPCIPTKRYPDKTLAHAIMNYYKQNNIQATIHLVNRLDKETSGYMLVAKDSHSHALLSTDIKQVKRVYHALVEGHINQEGIIDKPILKMEDTMKRSIDASGKSAKTYYKLIEYQGEHSLVECILETGRTHQIRVHLSSINHPLVGDTLYGSTYNQPFYLDSVEIAFIHPYTKEYIHIKK